MDAYVAPISHAQRRLWFLDRFEPGNAIYHIPVAVRLRGTLDRAAVQHALQTIVDRHDALRTTFAVENGEPVQVVHEALPLALATDSVANEADLAARLREEARRPFDLAQGPLLRARLLERAAADHVLLITIHHIVADGWSLGVLVDEFTELYRANVEKRPATLPELPIQFADFTDWQNESLASENAARELTTWQQHLVGAPTALELPADLPRPAAQSYRGALLLRTLPPELTGALQTLARREGATLFMTLLAAFETLLSRWSRQEEWMIGTPVAGRTRSETERLIGFFVNTLVLRVDLAGDPTFGELLARTKRECLAAFGRQETPFDRVVDAVQPARDRSRTPLFQVYFTLQNAPRRDLALPGLKAEVIEVDTGTAKVDLTLALEESPAGLAARWEYGTDVFAPETIARLADSYQTLLAAIVAQPDAPVTKLPLLSANARQTVLALGNGATRDFSTRESLGAWFSRQAALAPSSVAVVCNGEKLTYRELDARSNQLARHLRRAGVTPGSRVGLCLGRSLELVVGILGILKAGAAYVPLDPTYPRERLDFMVADSGIAALVALGAPAGIEHPHRIDLATQAEAIAAESADAFSDGVDADDAAYVIYTSGSTGRPKGCVVTHGNVTRLMRATEHWYGFGAADAWTLFHSYAFDFSVWEIWGALLYGGRLVVVPYEVSRNPEAFHDLLASERVTVLNQTPSAFRQLIAVDRERPANALALRYVIFGGEALELSMLQPWFERHGDDAPQVINMYGITETTVHVTYRRIRAADVAAGKGSVIGERIPDLTLFVVDERLEPLPVGVPGELLVGGAGLALGYLNRPELTAERFIANPFGAGRVYRSGDLARWLPDGDLEYLGRIDQQVKIRGFRIEPGEIERVIAAIPGVRECAVIPREEKAGEKKLVAYLVRQPDATSPDARTAREACRARLADYMVPAAFVFLERHPRTAHGKLDRRALPAPDAAEAATADYVAPETPAEKTLATIWSNVLGVPEVGTQDNFFALGGDSILTIQVVSLAAKAGLKLTPKDLFEAQTLAGLARAARPIESASKATTSATPVTAPASDAYPLTPMQAGMLFQSVLEPEAGVYFEQVWGELRGDLVPATFRAAWQGLVDRHPGLRTRFVWRDVPEPRQIVAPQATLPWQELDWTGVNAPADASAAWETLLAADRAHGFVFDAAPLMRVTIVRVGADRWRWLWSHHHLLLDGWCLPLVFQDVLGDYEHRLGRIATPPAPGLPYRAYVDWVLAQDLGAAERFWRNYLAGFAGAPELRLPAPSAADGPIAGELALKLSPTESTALRTWARKHGLTLNTLFQGAWALLLQHYGVGDDVVFGVTVAGRPAELPGVERIIGLFINTLPLRVHVTPDADATAWLQALQLAQAGMREFEHSPLASVQSWSEAPRGRALFESILVFENYPGDEAVRALRSSLQLKGLHTREQTNYPITVAVLPGDSITLKLHFDGRRFAPPAMQRMLTHWHRLAEALATPASAPLGRISPLRDEELARARTWSEAPATFGPAITVLDLISGWTEKSPDAPALLGPSREIGYRELQRRATLLAARLRQRGVRRGDRVAVCCEKTPELVVAMLGILHAGAAFVPLDPRFARERLAFIVEDTQPTALLVHTATAWVSELAAVPIFTLSPDARELASESTPTPALALTGDDLAYVIHTSGSTGRPKGVMLTHGGLTNLAQAQAAATGLGPGQRVLQFASISFDAAVSEIFMALVSGAALWLEPRDDVPDPREFAARLRAARIDHATLPPALLGALDSADFPALRTLLVAGEAASDTLYRTWARGRRLFNAYGPTEITVCATMAEIEAETDAITLGRPLANLTVFILDAQLSPCPVGVPGEICVGGVGVGRGYLGRPDLTAERFVPDPFSATPGARLYRTGDLGRWREDGRIEFLGRTDHQVKIRGFRVEPGEIEAVLQQHPAVGSALVLARDEGAGKHLVAYAIPRTGATPAATELRQHLAAKLPDYLVPRHFVVLAAWPLTSAGKIDRRALPSPSEEKTTDSAAPAAQLAGAIEETLGRIWREVLRLATVGPDDNFFELGGDSILSLQIVARAHQAGYALTPRQIFSSPTIRGLAAVATPIAASAAAESDETGSLPLTPIQHWFFQQNQPDAHHWNQSVVLELRHAISTEQLRCALAAVIARHGAFRLRFPVDATGVRQQVYANAETSCVELPEYPLASLTEVTTRLQTGFDLAKGPLWCAALFTGPAGTRPQLFLALHHLIVDGVSWRILAGDLAQACGQIVAGQTPALPSVPTSFARWSRSLVERAQTNTLRAELAHWRTLAGTAGELPLDFPPDAGAANVDAVETLNVELDATATASLLRDASAAYRLRADELLLAALARTLSEWTGRAATVVSLENHGREDLGDALDLSRTVGWFTSLFPFRLACASGATAGELLTETKENLRHVPHHGVGFGVLAHLCADAAVRRELAALPKPELCFNYLGQVDHTLGADAPFGWVDAATGPGSSPRGHRAHLLDVNAIVVGGRLRVTWIYSGRAHRHATIAKYAETFLGHVRSLLAHCASPEAGGPTPSDFTNVRLDASELDALLDDLAEPSPN
jgi:amino acid adenylation domain-containing protein/non-ribosomal peptide synthase protein (TIGR01720 family)